MTGMDWMRLFLGAGAGAALLTLLSLAARGFAIGVEDEHVALVTSFGKLVAKYDKPGLVFHPTKWMPWVKVTQVSLARDFRVIHDLHLNDARGTTVVVDLWLELRIVDPEKALFAVEDWDKATQNLVLHAAMTILGSRDFQEILDDRSDLGSKLQRDVSAETERWGVKVDQVFVRHVRCCPKCLVRCSAPWPSVASRAARCGPSTSPCCLIPSRRWVARAERLRPIGTGTRALWLEFHQVRA